MRAFILSVAAAGGICLVLISLSSPTDTDSDGMSDEYENFFGLNYTNAADAQLNYDQDTLINLNEYAIWTDPFATDTDRDGWHDGEDSNAVSRAFIAWGDSYFTTSNNYEYAAPDWWVAAYKIDGQWQTNPSAWRVSADTSNGIGCLNIEVDRTILTNDAVMRLHFYDHTNASLYIDLYDTNDVIIATNLFGNLMQGSNVTVTQNFNIAFETNLEAVGIQIRRGIGEVHVYESLLYVDKDEDGLDKEQENQLGTSDNDTDSDNDELSDYDEVFIHNTNPADSDSDNDGLSDGAEVNTYGTDPNDSDTDNDGINDGEEVARGKDPAVSNSYSMLPFMELFETNTVTVGNINGQNNWEAAPTNAAFVQTNMVYEGDQALKIDNGISGVCTVRQLFASSGANIVWIDMYIQTSAAFAQTGQVSRSAALYFNKSGQLVVYDGLQGAGNKWVTLTNHTPVSAAEWVRVSIKLDYGVQQWLICLKGIVVAEGLGFASQTSEFIAFTIKAEQGLADKVNISTNKPEGISVDWDSLPDDWEIQHFGNLDQTDNGDLDGDGLTNLGEYQYGTDPNDSDTDNDGAEDLTEVQWNRNPTNADSYATLPWTCDFEAVDGYSQGDLDGQENWSVIDGTALIQTNTVFTNSQAVKVEVGADGQAWVGQIFASVTNPVVWTHYRVQTGPSALPESLLIRATAVCAVNETGRWACRHSSDWIIASNYPCAQTGEWTHVTFKEDFNARKWDFYVGQDAVFTNLYFADTNADHFARFAFFGCWQSNMYFDMINIGTNVPGHIDQDGDGLVNDKEIELGTDSLNPDSDGDGMSDGIEFNYGFNPAVSNLYFRIDVGSGTNTWTTGFEPSEGYTTNALNSQNGWVASNEVAVVDTENHTTNGVQSVYLPSRGSTNGPTKDMQANIGAYGRQQAWITVYVKLLQQGMRNECASAIKSGAVFINNNRLFAYDGVLEDWKVSERQFSINTNTWTRIDLEMDYAAKKYLACVNGVLAVEGVNFKNTDLACLSRLKVSGSPSAQATSSYVDDIRLSTQEPAGLDFDDDGLSNFDEYAAGTDPRDSDTDNDGLPDKWEVDNGTDPLTNDANSDLDGDQLTNMEEYLYGTLANNPDCDDDALLDSYEVKVSGTDPFDSDTDDDTLNDYWEVRYGLNPFVTTSTNADPDNDGLTNALEQALGTNPLHTDSDGDGMTDDWENTNSLSPTDGLLTSLVSWWRFDEESGSIAYDDNMMWSNDGRLVNDASRSPLGYTRHTVELDGDNDYVLIPDHYSLNSTSDFTLTMWIKITAFDTTNQPIYFASKEDTSDHVEYALSYIKSSQSLRFSHCNLSSQSETVSVLCPLSSDVWTHLAVAVSNASVSFYTNGVLDGTAQTLSYARSNLGDLIIGSTLDSGAVDPTVHGLIDEVRVYNTALSPSLIDDLMEGQGDGDGDGLTNREEYEIGTDPAVDDTATDSDNDGLSNYDEIKTYGTDPFNQDSDGDGATDGYEVNTLGTDPLVADQGSDPGAPTVTILYPEDGAYILW